MFTTIVILAIIVCILLGLIILIQNPKGGGLASGFTGTNNIMGVQRTGDFLEKGTWILAITLMVLAIMSNLVIPNNGAGNDATTEIQNQIDKPAAPAQSPAPIPAAPADTNRR